MITIDDFKKIDLCVAKIISAERIVGSEKLLTLQVDIGEEQRQIVAGIGLVYDPKILIGKEIIVVRNLEPRLLMGVTSNGMLLAAGNDHPVLLRPDEDVPPGSPIR